jgi:RecA/RadA recombinase
MSKNKEKEKEVMKSSDVLSSFLKQNSEDHYNFETEIDYKVSSGSLQLDLHLGGGLGPGLHRFCGMNEGGKEQPVSEPVLTPSGWFPIGSLNVGDKIIDSNGNEQLILGVFPQGEKDVYEVEFNDGSVVRCGIEHLWETSSFQERHNGKRSSVKSLQYIKDTLRYGSHLNHSIKLVKPIEFATKELPVPPYLLGAIIGDGGITSSVLISNVDSEVWDGIDRDMKSTDRYNGYQIVPSDSTGITNRISFLNIRNNPVKDDLLSLGLFGLKSHEKFIPEIYKFGSKHQRIELIRGLIDTDGYVNSKKSEVLYYSTSEKLVDDVIELARSLGCLAKKRFKKSSYIKLDGVRKICKDCFIAALHFPHEIIPCTIKRKIDALSFREINFCHFIKDVRLIGKEESVCIKVSSIDSLYVTKDYVLTHNTSSALSFMKNFLTKPKAKGFYIKAEGRLSKEMQERSGVKFVFAAEEWVEGTCFVFESNIYETVVDAMRQLVAKNEEGNIYFFLLDSVDGLITKGDLDKGFEDSNKVAGGAVIAANFMKRLSIALAKRGHMAVFISQVRADIKLDPYSKAPIRQTTATGGNALLHFANWILEFEPRHKGDLILQNAGDSKIHINDNPVIGHFAKATVKKSPIEKTNLTISYPIRYGRTNGTSIWIEKEVVDMLYVWEFLSKKGAWITPTEEFKEFLAENNLTFPDRIQGNEKLFNVIEEDKALLAFLISYFKKTINNEV